MKLLATRNSPYSRIVRICALELGLDLPVEFVGVRDQADEILKYNPAGKVPTLVMDAGNTLSDTRVICEEIEIVRGGAFLAARNDLTRRGWEGICTGFLDGVAVWVREQRRDAADRSARVIDLERSRTSRCLSHFESNWPRMKTVDFASSALVSCLQLLDTRVAPALLSNYSAMSGWYQEMLQTSSINSTQPEPVG